MDPISISGVSGLHPVAFFVVGELDRSRQDEIEDLVRWVDTAPQTTVDMDMSEVTFVDSTGLRALLRANQYLADRGCDLRLVDPQRQLVKLLDFTGIRDVLTIWFTDDDTLA